MGAEDVLHDLGVIPITSSDAQGMGRAGETVRRTFAVAGQDEGRAAAPSESRHDNDRVLRYIAKLTINPAIAHGLSHEIGSLDPGKLADIVLWKPGSASAPSPSSCSRPASPPAASATPTPPSTTASPWCSARSSAPTAARPPISPWPSSPPRPRSRPTASPHAVVASLSAAPATSGSPTWSATTGAVR